MGAAHSATEFGLSGCINVDQNKVSNIIRRLMDNMKLLLIRILRVLLSHSFIFFRFYFSINVYMVLFLFDNVIYVFYCYDYVFLFYVYV